MRAMRDQYGRTIEYMRVSVTDRCNLRCIYCMPETGVHCVPHSEILTFDEIARVCRIGSGLGIRKIKLTGGEPLVRRGLPELVKMLKDLPGIEQVTLTSNGILLKEQLGNLVAAGLDAVNISIDTLDQEEYRRITRIGDIADAAAGLEAAVACGKLRVKINCVPLRDVSPDTYIKLALLARDENVDVRFIEMMPIGFGKEFAGRSGGEIVGVLREQYGEPEIYNKKIGNGPAEYFSFPGFKGKIGLISAVSHQFCSTCNRVRLTSEGALKLCLQYNTAVDLRSLLRSGADDDLIRETMRRAIYEKPACHHFDNAVPGQSNDASEWQEKIETREMSQIGG